MSAACLWPVDYTSCGCSGGACSILGDMSDSERMKFEQAATDMLWNLTNRLFGACEVSVRPCTQGCDGGRWVNTFWGRGPFPWAGVGSGPWYPVIIDGKWYNLTCGCANPGTCNCAASGPTALRLPGPVQSIVEVTVDGVIVPSSAYRLDYHRVLIRTDGGVWPQCQDLLADPSQPNTFEVTYLKGVPVPIGGQMAAGSLACELAKAACHDNTCQLPQRVQTITRQGVTVGLLDGFEGLDEGKIGIWSIDAWVASVNRPRPTSAVRSPDYQPPVGIRP